MLIATNQPLPYLTLPYSGCYKCESSSSDSVFVGFGLQ